jgi:hypothetical protein
MYVNRRLATAALVKDIDDTLNTFSGVTRSTDRGVVSLCRLKQSLSLRKVTTTPQPNHTVTPTHIEPEQHNT